MSLNCFLRFVLMVIRAIFCNSEKAYEDCSRHPELEWKKLP